VIAVRHDRGMLTAAEELAAGPVVLRRWRANDAGALHRAVRDSIEHLAPWMSWVTDGYSTKDAEDYVARVTEKWGTDYDYALIAPGDVVAGCCSLMARAGFGGFEIGYWVHRCHTGRGYATAAAAALTAEAFRIGADRVEIVHDVANVASGAIPRRLGFAEVERRPAEDPAPGGTGEVVVWRLRTPR
jgi:ribosomal-protein-serine acetyltransferase